MLSNSTVLDCGNFVALTCPNLSVAFNCTAVKEPGSAVTFFATLKSSDLLIAFCISVPTLKELGVLEMTAPG